MDPAVQLLVVVPLAIVIAAGNRGRVSVTETPVSVAALPGGLATVMVRVTMPPVPMNVGLKLLVTVGGLRNAIEAITDADCGALP